MRSVPKAHRKHYNRILRRDGRQAADRWLAGLGRQKAAKPSAPAGRGGNAGLVAAVPQCAADYAKLVANPFDRSLAPCLPVAPAFPSQKISVKKRGTFHTGSTSKMGYVMFAPHRGMATQPASASCPVFYSGSTWNSNETSVNGVGTVQTDLDSPYSSTDFGPDAEQLQARLVHAAIRVKYVGKVLDRGGALVAYSDPDGQNLETMALTDLLVFDGAEVAAPPESAWLVLGYAGGRYDSGDFLTNTTGGAPSMAIIWNSPDGGAELEFEIRAVYEVIGPKARGKTASHTAERQTAAVQAAKESSPGWQKASLKTDVIGALEATGEVTTAAMRTGGILTQAYMALKSIPSFLASAAEEAPLLLTAA